MNTTHILVGVALVGVLFFGTITLYLSVKANILFRSYCRYFCKRTPTKPTSVSVHTYKPKDGIIPYRGQCVLDRAMKFARLYNCPLILSVGLTNDIAVMEAEIYEAEVARFAPDITVIIGKDPFVRETAAEAREAQRICHKLDSSLNLVVALQPHAARIEAIWKKLLRNDDKLTVYIVPVKGPAKYWIWETCMFIMHFLAPPGSKRQSLILDLVGRKG